jgi:hypothetical protein
MSKPANAIPDAGQDPSAVGYNPTLAGSMNRQMPLQLRRSYYFSRWPGKAPTGDIFPESQLTKHLFPLTK